MAAGRQLLSTVRGRLDLWLFPETPALRLGRRWELALVLLAALALGTLAELFRPGLAGSLHTLWAEDSLVFVQGSLRHGMSETLFTVYPEYLVVGPWLIADLASIFPLRDAAFVVSLTSAILIALSGIVVWVASAGILRNPCLRATLAVVTVLAPVSGLEAVDSASYVSWYLLVASFWLLFYRPRSSWAAILAGLFILLTGLSNPGLWFFAPLAGLRLLAVRNRRDVAIVAGYTLAAGAQVVATLQHPSVAVSEWTNEIVTVYLQRVVNGSVFGLRWGGDLWDSLGWTLLIGLLVLFAVGLGFGFWRASGRARAIAALSILISILTFFVSMYQRAAAPALFWGHGGHIDPGGRYAIVPALLLIGAALVLIDDRLRPGARVAPALAGIAVVVLLVATASSFWLEAYERGHPSWTENYDATARACEAEPLPEVTIPSWPPGFGVTVACESLTSNAAVAKPAAGSP